MPTTIPALSSAPPTRTETAAPTPPVVVPDGCNLGVVLRLVLAVLTLCLGVAYAASAPGGPLLGHFYALAGFAIPVTLLSLVTWCLTRRWLPARSARLQRLVAWVVPVVWTLVALFVLRVGASALEAHTMLGALLAALAGGVFAQHYFELRARAFSPALVEAKYQALQSRIRPHFLFNSLNSVLGVIATDPPRAERMLENLAELLRAVMADTRNLVPVEQEIDLCRRYVEIEQSRLGERLHVDWQIGAIHPHARIPQLLLQPIIENAIRYGAEKIEGECEITVRVRQLGFQLEIFVANPIAHEPVEREGNQIGLTNIRDRLALVYDLEAKLQVRKRAGRFELSLTLPVDRNR